MRPFMLALSTVVLVSIAAGDASPGLGSLALTTLVEQGRRLGDTIWVANRDAGAVTVVEAATGVVVRTFRSGDGPHDIAISAPAGKAYVMNELEDRISVFSAATLDLLKTISVPRPHHAKVSPDGRAVYVGLFNSSQIAVIDTATDGVRIVPSSSNPAVRAHAPRASNGGRFIFVPHEVGDELTALDASTGAIVGRINPGAMPTEVLPASDGRRLFVAMRGEGRIKVVDLATALITGSVTVGTQPESMILANDDRTLIASMRGTPAAVAFVDANALTLLGTVPIGGAGTFGDLAVPSPDKRLVYATFDAGINGIGGVAVLDTSTGQRLAVWAYPGTGRPHGIAYSTVPITVP
jgi:DNA-binding beta-propeller fold protein YncE